MTKNRRPRLTKKAQELFKKEGIVVGKTVKAPPSYSQVEADVEKAEVEKAVESVKHIALPRNKRGAKKLDPEERVKRNDFIIDLYRKNYTISSICKLLKVKYAQQLEAGYHEPWGELSERMILTIMRDWHNEMKSSSTTEEREIDEAKRTLNYDKMEGYVEMFARELSRKQKAVDNGDEKWAPHELTSIISEMAKIQQWNIENQNWNKSRANMAVQINNNTLLAMIQRESPKTILAPSPAMKELQLAIMEIEDEDKV